MERCRRVATVAWLACAAAWLAQAFVPWTAVGPLSNSTLLDAAALIQDRILVSIPRWTAWLALLLPALAAGLAVLSLLRGKPAVVARWGLGVLGIVVVAVLARELTEFRLARFGVGAWLGIVGVVAVAVAMSLEWKTRSRHEVLS